VYGLGERCRRRLEFRADIPGGDRRGYRLWIRGGADADSWTNDSIYAQFSDSVGASGAAIYRIGTSSATTLTVEDCNGYGVKGWGWQDNGYGSGVVGPLIYFAAAGTHTLRIQTREDGLRLDGSVFNSTSLNRCSDPPPPPPPPAAASRCRRREAGSPTRRTAALCRLHVRRGRSRSRIAPAAVFRIGDGRTTGRSDT